MKLTKRQLFLLTEIISKTKKDELTGNYTIYPKDYLFYNLNKTLLKNVNRKITVLSNFKEAFV